MSIYTRTTKYCPNALGRQLLESIIHTLISSEDIMMKSSFNLRVVCNLFALYEMIFEQLVLNHKLELGYSLGMRDSIIKKHYEMTLRRLTQAIIDLTISRDIKRKNKELLLECEKIKVSP